MTYKKHLLLYLYENNFGSVEIYPVSEKISVSNVDMKKTIIDLKKDGLIDTDDKYRQIGCGDPSRLETVKSLHVKARITKTGEQYVRDTYIKINGTPIINAHQVVYANGDINAPISQANDHSDSKASQSISTDKKENSIAFQIIKYASIILSAIVAAITIYQFFIK